MKRSTPAASWFGPEDPAFSTFSPPDTSDPHSAFIRLWQGLMTARVMLSIAVLLFQVTLYLTSPMGNFWVLGLCGMHLIITLLARLLSTPTAQPWPSWHPPCIAWVVVDLAFFASLNFFSGAGMHYSALFALPVLLAATLSSRQLALSVAAAATLVLLLQTAWLNVYSAEDHATAWSQAGLAGLSFFLLALFANQLASRLAREEQRAQRRGRTLAMQQQVNNLVMVGLSEGVLVIDHHSMVHAANPAAHQLLLPQGPQRSTPFSLALEASWQPLMELARQTLYHDIPQQAKLTLTYPNQQKCHLHARTQMTRLPYPGDDLCVMFLRDLREMQAHARTEKLAAMGRISAALAHEIRNPLAAITQANTLLEEDLDLPRHKQLTTIVSQNAKRLDRTVNDVLNLARVQNTDTQTTPPTLRLDHTVRQVIDEWRAQQSSDTTKDVQLISGVIDLQVQFDADHLRRVLVNLLDNAWRYADHTASPCVVVQCNPEDLETPKLCIWSAGPPLEHSVQQHLFEPFFSSESRSSGLGLYISRELCERYGAHLQYRRGLHTGQEGNVFDIVLRRA